MPYVIQPPGGIRSAPENTSLVQIGFEYGLNYPFVADDNTASEQIFHYLPMGLAYGLGINTSEVVMHSLQPYNTLDSLGYITTLAIAYIPENMVNSLTLSLDTAVSALYNPPDNSTKTLMSLINPSFPIMAGDPLDSNDAGATSTASALGSSPTNNAAAPIGATAVVKNTIRGTSVGIGVGVVAGAAAYGVAMFYVARRYKRRKQGHLRVSSVMGYNQGTVAGSVGTYGSMTGGAGAFMSGGRGGAPGGGPTVRHTDTWHSRGSGYSSNGRSVREAGISAPMMAENSLGWH